MIGLDADLGIAAALMGLSVDKAAVTSLAARGIQTAAWDVQLGKVPQFTVGQIDMRTRGVLSPVSLYRFGPQGKYRIEKWPAISYNLVGLRYDRGPRRVHPRDQVSVPVEGTKITMTSAYGTTLTGYAQRRVRAHPEPFVLRYDVSIWALNDGELQPLMATVLDRLSPNGGLPVVWADGSKRVLGLTLVNMVNINPEDRDPTLSAPDAQREWHWVYTYEVETWMDNTLATTLQRTITQPTELDMSRLPEPEAP